MILASRDIDIRVFAKQYAEMGAPKPKFTIFVSQDDKALAASSLITGRVAPLGGIDPTAEPYRSRLEEASIAAIDLTKVKTGDRLNHGKFAESPEIVQFIGQRLMTGQPLTDSSVTLGQSVAAVDGDTVRTVGTVATAPLKIGAEPAARRPADDIGGDLHSDPDGNALTRWATHSLGPDASRPGAPNGEIYRR